MRHRKRWLTGLIALLILFIPVFWGGALFVAFVAVVSAVAMHEYYNVAFGRGGPPWHSPVLLTGIAVTAVTPFAAWYGPPEMVGVVVAGNLLAIGALSLRQFGEDPGVTAVAVKEQLGVVYIPLMLSFLVRIRAQPDGIAWLLLVLAVVFVGDTAAYHVGSAHGKRKLAPAVSPGKTVEGALGGLAGNLAAGALFKAMLLPSLPWLSSIGFILTMGIVGQIGDLFESQFKRINDIKDSGTLLPGHGGILDRIDALLFASPVAYLFHLTLG
ncbi:MAG: phosphatidate cytidylyltransferase [Desulfobacteraceae bacterium]|nr:phosphatidate cytidylyltransferase [Desulfobacteraceae bacterium]